MEASFYRTRLSMTVKMPPPSGAIEAGALPPGLSLNASTGTISGTPNSAGTHNFTVRVGDSASPTRTASRALAIAVAPGPVAITTTALNSGRRNRAYSQTLQATGGTKPYSWSIVGTLPPGLALTASTGTISGTPTTAGTFTFTVQVADDSSPKKTVTKVLSIKIRN